MLIIKEIGEVFIQKNIKVRQRKNMSIIDLIGVVIIYFLDKI
jgi:hypothetical protein